MAVLRRLVAQDDNTDNQWLKIDHPSRFIINLSSEWQFLFGPNSELTNSVFVPKIWARFDDDSFQNIKIIAYLYNNFTATIGNAASCSFSIYKVSLPDWTENLITTISGVQLTNNYFYINPTINSLTGTSLFGEDTLMIEVELIRSGIAYRDRIYVNHLGIYDNTNRLRQDIDWLEISKVDE